MTLKEFLKIKKLLSEFKKECIKFAGDEHHKNCLQDQGMDAIACAFIWQDTHKGLEFWADVSAEWCDIAKNK